MKLETKYSIAGTILIIPVLIVVLFDSLYWGFRESNGLIVLYFSLLFASAWCFMKALGYSKFGGPIAEAQ